MIINLQENEIAIRRFAGLLAMADEERGFSLNNSDAHPGASITFQK